MTAEAQAADIPLSPSRTTLIVYFGALIAMFMAVLDMQIIVTALPTIAGELGDLHLFGWVGASFLLSTAAVAPFYGKLGDLYGRKKIFLTSIVIFMVGWLVVGSGRCGRVLDVGVARATSAAGGRDHRQDGRPAPRTGAGARCRSPR